VINMVAIISSIKAMPYWSTGYLLGWSIGVVMMLRVEALEAWEVFVHFFVIVLSMLILMMRLLKQMD